MKWMRRRRSKEQRRGRKLRWQYLPGDRRGKAKKYPAGRTGSLCDDLQRVLETAGGQPMSVGAIMDVLSMRGHVLLLAFFGIPLCSPIGIPVVSTAFGIILIILTWFLILNRRPWLPDRVRGRVIPYESLENMVRRVTPYAEWIEKRLKHRLPFLSEEGVMMRVHACYMFVLALVVSVPMLTNAPAAIPIVLMSLGLLKRDGLFILAGYIAGIPCIVLYAVVGYLGLEGLEKLVRL